QDCFQLAPGPSYSEADFIVSDTNRQAWDSIHSDDAWPQRRLLLIGAAASGKSHLASIWARNRQARIVDYEALGTLSAERLSSRCKVAVENVFRRSDVQCEMALFRLCEMASSQDGLLLMTSRPFAESEISLVDLRSRIGSTRLVHLYTPDREFLVALVVKLFADRQLSVAREVVSYIVDRMERSYSAAVDLVNRLDRISLARGRRMTLSMVREVLSEQRNEETLGARDS
ncbi:MAG: hypothetical protein OXJ64_17110, partial [Boseongicola sp.]|nr:hypothetical protein [Boseongicola sp.]